VQGKAGKGLLRCYIGKTTGLSRAQLTRLIGQYLATGKIEERGTAADAFQAGTRAGGHRTSGRSGWSA
jgi:hypothetical protein